MTSIPRVAFFTDSVNELNGLALTSRQFLKFVRRTNRPLLCVHADAYTGWSRDGSLSQLSLKRSPAAIRLDDDLKSDLLYRRFASDAVKAVRDFAPDVLHITGPGDIGQLGLYVAHKLKIPLVASWHTNFHQYAAQRLLRSFTNTRTQTPLQRWVEHRALDWTLTFYRSAQVLLAPNQELQSLLAGHTGKPVYLMPRGVEADTFSPIHRLRLDHKFKLGYVGRLRREKNVRVLFELEKYLIDNGISNYQFVIVGAGSEQKWLSQYLQRVVFTGQLEGQSLVRTYANFDLFVFPSRTDTFGNAVLEALASGVPAIVTSDGGPKFIIQSNEYGAVAQADNELCEMVLQMIRKMTDPVIKQKLRDAARERALQFTWPQVFEGVYKAYKACLSTQAAVETDNARTVVAQPATAPVNNL